MSEHVLSEEEFQRFLSTQSNIVPYCDFTRRLADAAYNLGIERGKAEREPQDIGGDAALISEARAAIAAPVGQEEWAKGAEPFILELAGDAVIKDGAGVADSVYALRAYLRSHPAFVVRELSRADIETLWRAYAPCNITDYGTKPHGGVHMWLVEMVSAIKASGEAT
jgi:hypothetical protein